MGAETMIMSVNMKKILFWHSIHTDFEKIKTDKKKEISGWRWSNEEKGKKELKDTREKNIEKNIKELDYEDRKINEANGAETRMKDKKTSRRVENEETGISRFFQYT